MLHYTSGLEGAEVLLQAAKYAQPRQLHIKFKNRSALWFVLWYGMDVGNFCAQCASYHDAIANVSVVITYSMCSDDRTGTH